jgi:hypothetical protein
MRDGFLLEFKLQLLSQMISGLKNMLKRELQRDPWTASRFFWYPT